MKPNSCRGATFPDAHARRCWSRKRRLGPVRPIFPHATRVLRRSSILADICYPSLILMAAMTWGGCATPTARPSMLTPDTTPDSTKHSVNVTAQPLEYVDHAWVQATDSQALMVLLLDFGLPMAWNYEPWIGTDGTGFTSGAVFLGNMNLELLESDAFTQFGVAFKASPNRAESVASALKGEGLEAQQVSFYMSETLEPEDVAWWSFVHDRSKRFWSFAFPSKAFKSDELTPFVFFGYDRAAIRVDDWYESMKDQMVKNRLGIKKAQTVTLAVSSVDADSWNAWMKLASARPPSGPAVQLVDAGGQPAGIRMIALEVKDVAVTRQVLCSFRDRNVFVGEMAFCKGNSSKAADLRVRFSLLPQTTFTFTE